MGAELYMWSELGIIFPPNCKFSALPPWFDLHTGSMGHMQAETLVSSLRSVRGQKWVGSGFP